MNARSVGMGRGHVWGWEGTSPRRAPPEIGVRHSVIHREVGESSAGDSGRARRTGRGRGLWALFPLEPGGGLFSRGRSRGGGAGGAPPGPPRSRRGPAPSPPLPPRAAPVGTDLTFTAVAAPCGAPGRPARLTFRFHQPFGPAHEVQSSSQVPQLPRPAPTRSPWKGFLVITNITE